ncbi:MAG: capsular polysaccharide biosynthesis protein CapF [Sphaerochaetaceae bacterium]|nr:capsular polysaccharide biosynthesis protein CapF [Sphaerochaetaceae bacterium]
MNVLITGANGFIGKNLIATLETIQDGRNNLYPFFKDKELNLLKYDIDTEKSLLDEYCKIADFVFHLAGVNRPKNEEDFMKGNFGFTSELLDTLKKYSNKAPVLITSSIQAALDNPYGKSKKAGEDLMFKYSKDTQSKVYVFRLPNVFGKWCRPNYNSAVATFCNNIANDLPIKVNNPNVLMNLVYIDDVVAAFIKALNNDVLEESNYCFIQTIHKVKLGKIVELLNGFKDSRINLSVPNMNNEFEKVLYSTYLSYLPTDKFSYPVKMNIDNRGSFTEIIKTDDRGQFSVNKSNVGITKGNHWHHSKNEKFLVVQGKALIQFRKVGRDENGNEYPVIDYHVSGDRLEVVDIPTGYTHNIINEGDTELITFMWANEKFNKEKPDTYFLEV